MSTRGDAGRLEDLEHHAAHSDRALDDLHAAVTAQWAVIEALQRRLALLERRLAEEADRSRDGPGPAG